MEKTRIPASPCGRAGGSRSRDLQRGQALTPCSPTGVVVIFVIILVLGLLRWAFARRQRSQLAALRRRTPSSEENVGDPALPPYQPNNPEPTRSPWSLILSPRGPTPEPTITEEERRRRRIANAEVRQALIDAGLLLGPTRSRTRDARARLRDSDRAGIRALAEEMVAEEERSERRLREERRARRERREARRERRRIEEEGAGLPAYSQKAGGDEEVLEMGEGITRRREAREAEEESSGSDEDEDTPLQPPTADLSRPPTSHSRS